MTRSAAGLRFAMLSPCFWPEVRRGSERIIRDLATGMATRGHHPRLITSHPGRPTRTEEEGLEVIRNWRPPDGLLRGRQFEDHLSHLPFSYLSLRGGEDQLAHAFFPTDALVAGRWSRRTGRPAVLTFAGLPDRAGLLDRRLRLALTRHAVGSSDAVTVVSRAAADAFRRWLGVDAEVIYPGIDPGRFSADRSRQDEEPTIVFAGAVGEPRKRFDLMVDAFRLVRRSRRSARLLAFRPPGDAGARLGEVAGLELLDPDQEPVNAYRRAWVSALPAVGEAFGLVLAEGMACGIPGVGSRHGGIPEVITGPEVGRTFEDDQGAEGLAGALLEALELAEDPATEQRCVQRAQEFSSDRASEAYERLYLRLLD